MDRDWSVEHGSACVLAALENRKKGAKLKTDRMQQAVIGYRGVLIQTGESWLRWLQS